MENSLEDLTLAAAQAEDTQNLLNHIAWEKVIKPKLTLLRSQYSDMLVEHDLGAPLPGSLTRERLAGRIYGIRYIMDLFEKILTQGDKAFEVLRSSGFSFDQEQ